MTPVKEGTTPEAAVDGQQVQGADLDRRPCGRRQAHVLADRLVVRVQECDEALRARPVLSCSTRVEEALHAGSGRGGDERAELDLADGRGGAVREQELGGGGVARSFWVDALALDALGGDETRAGAALW